MLPWGELPTVGTTNKRNKKGAEAWMGQAWGTPRTDVDEPTNGSKTTIGFRHGMENKEAGQDGQGARLRQTRHGIELINQPNIGPIKRQPYIIKPGIPSHLKGILK